MARCVFCHQYIIHMSVWHALFIYFYFIICEYNLISYICSHMFISLLFFTLAWLVHASENKLAFKLNDMQYLLSNYR